MNIWWIRRDLRLADNQALSAALDQDASVLPVFILDEHILSKPAEKRQAFLFAGLRTLDTDLRRIGSRLLVRRGNPVDEIPRLVAESGAERVFAEQDVSPYALRRDETIARQVDLHLVHGLGMHPPTAVTPPDGKAYTVFTPYSRAWRSLPFSEYTIPAPINLLPALNLPADAIPETPAPTAFPPGEHEAQRRLSAFIDGPIFSYENGRNQLDLDGTSTLSPYLRFGMLSARTAFSAAHQAAQSAPDNRARLGCETWLNELIWREFYQSILYHFPYVLRTAFKPSLRNIPWRYAPADLQAWQIGQTGYPVVDAAMRQLASTGWMHNRGRMIAASFLAKHLLINWQEGERWFMRTLIDGDPAANNGGWQWTAGTGTDAAPYFRIFNPIIQGTKFDPEGKYVRKWVPELANLPVKYIHKPWEMSSTEQRRWNVIIGRDYPYPIVEHAFARQRVLEAFQGKRKFDE